MFCIPHRIPKHLDEAGFDELIQFLRLPLAKGDEMGNRIQLHRDSLLFLFRRQVKRQPVKHWLCQMAHCRSMRLPRCLFQQTFYLIHEEIFINIYLIKSHLKYVLIQHSSFQFPYVYAETGRPRYQNIPCSNFIFSIIFPVEPIHLIPIPRQILNTNNRHSHIRPI